MAVLRVLLIEDTEVDALMITRALQKGGYAPLIHRVETAEAFAVALNEGTWDVVLADWSLPHFGALRGLKILQMHELDVPFIVVTGTVSDETAVAAMKAGANDIVRKDSLARLAPAVAREVSDAAQRTARVAADERYRTLARNFPNGAVFLFDHDLRYSLAGGTGLQASGLTEEMFAGKTLWEIFPPEIAERDEPVLRAALGGETTQVEVPFGEKTFAVHTLPVYDDRGAITGGMVMTQDITERKRSEMELRQYAFYDRLTSLPNRACFLDRVSQSLDRVQRGEVGSCAVIFLDLDQFKVVNDSLGHVAGDQLLVEIAHRLNSMVHTSSTLARFGGDEFAFLIEDVDGSSSAVQVAERIHHVLAVPFTLEEHQVVVTSSIGIALTCSGEEQPEDLIRNADIAMYRAKTSGKRRHVLFDPAMHVHAVERLQMESDLRSAIEHGAFVLHYQPVVHLKREEIVGVEALARWLHPERGMISPNTFIPLAEETGLIVPIGTWILRTACMQMAAWQAEGVAPPYIAVNVSVKQLHQHDLAFVIKNILDETGIPPASLAIEITETGMMEDVTLANSVLAQVQRTGVRVLAVDDWGTGYASLSYLQKLPVTHIKIDRAFVHDITTNPNNAELVRAMIAMARALNLQTIAEGVETDDQRAQLQRYGCDAIQGYLISRPVPADALARELRQQASCTWRKLRQQSRSLYSLVS